MLDGVLRSRLEGSRLVLSGDRNHREEMELEGAVLYMRGTSSDLVVKTITEFDNIWHAGGDRISAEIYVKHTNYVEMPTLRPVSLSGKSETRFGISAEMYLDNHSIYGFQGERFLGRARKAYLYIVSAENMRAAVEFHSGDEPGSDAPFVNVSIQLPYDVFQSTFKPLWLGAPQASIDVTVGVCGFQRADAFDGEAGDFVMASGAWSADLKSLSLSITSGQS